MDSPARKPLAVTRRHVAYVLTALTATVLITFTVVYRNCAERVDRALAEGAFSRSSNIYAAAKSIAVGDPASVATLAADLRLAGYAVAERGGALEIRGHGESVKVAVAKGQIARIESGGRRAAIDFRPALIANLAQGTRERRRLVRFEDLPPVLVNALLAVEDKRFFRHSGFDTRRMAKAVWVDLREGRKVQGASTLTMQLVRNLWLGPEKEWRRKATEMLMTMHLENKLTKRQILEYYANQIYLGRRGTFSIHGFGEGARVYFGKRVERLSVTEAALLAGLIQRPSYFNPFRYPERARVRRNVVLQLMRENGFLDEAAWRTAAAEPVRLDATGDEASVMQYFVDLVDDETAERLVDRAWEAGEVRTTLDMDLQRAAAAAITRAMPAVDKLAGKKNAGASPPQVALVALSPATGEVKALIGGRDYAQSQLNRAVALRQPGSVFKPFVFAAALAHSVSPATSVVDEPTRFLFARQAYEPGNFGGGFQGPVTMRRALAKSLNVATVKYAEMTGYARVVQLARAAGLNGGIRATPAVALGAYEVTPLEMAGAYTIFASGGTYVPQTLVAEARSRSGEVLMRRPDPRRVLDPRVAFQMVSLLSEVMRSGTAAGARSRGFVAPAAGKTGTSRDGWFAGFTSELVTVVWVGYDDGRDLGLEGSKSALPVWTEFMKTAMKFKRYSNAREFSPPQGLTTAHICTHSGKLAGDWCEFTAYEVFVPGSEPREECEEDEVYMWQASAPVGVQGDDR